MPYKKYVKDVPAKAETIKHLYAYAVYGYGNNKLLAIYTTKKEAVIKYEPSEVKKVLISLA